MKKYIKDTIWALSIIAFVGCMIMAFWHGEILYCLAAAVFGTVAMVFALDDYNDNENHLNEQKKRMHL
jgi:heme O synthase-like polyprenyltransferase